MKKLALCLLLFLTAPFLHGQANIGGLLFASNFAQWTVPQGNQGQMSWSSPSFCTVTSGGATFRAFTVGVPITLVDSETPANTEVITPTQANYSGFGCSISAHTVNPHNSFYFRTATAGLGEALAFAGTATYQVLLTPDWTRLGGQTSTITSATGNTSVTILDQRSAVIVPYVWGGSAYASQPFGGGAVSSVFTRAGNVVAATGDYTVAQVTGAAPLASPALTGIPTVPTAAPGTSTAQAASTAYVLANSSGSQKVVYASKITGVTTGVAVTPGSSATGTVDSATAINTAIASGNVDLEVDSGFALSTSLVLSSNTTIHCIAPQYGFIMQTASNASVIVNAHQNSPTTASGTGGFLPSNITDQGIEVKGCTLNANSTQAVTGTNSQGTAHGATPGGKFTYGIFMGAVNDVIIDDNTIYDTGCFNVFFTNATQVWVTNNYLQQPTPTVNKKFTDAMHVIGPAQFVYLENNNLTSGDDAIALNADDGNRTGSGDVNSSYVQAFVKWGPILDVHVDNTTLDYTDYGLRIYSATELVDRIFITNTEGTNCGNNGLIAALSAIGPGNMGKISIDGWIDQTDGTCNVFTVPYNFWLSANIQNLEINRLSYSNPAVNWPILTQTAGQIGTLSLRDWNVSTTGAGLTFSNLIALTGGTINQLLMNSINWNDLVGGTNAVLSGAAVPSSVTCTNYTGPNRLLASGFAPGNLNGDCFANSYPTPYVATSFNEAGSGALAATTPATLLNGASGTWTAAAGGPSGGGVWTYTGNSVTLSGPCTAGGTDNFCPVTINAGTQNYIFKVNVSRMTFNGGALPGLGFVTRWTNNQNFVTFLPNGGSGSTVTWGLYDVVANVTTQIGSSATLGQSAGIWTVVMNGTSAKLTNPAGVSMSGTISGSNTATNVGLSDNTVSFAGGSDVVNYFSLTAIPTTVPNAATGSTCGTVGTVTGGVEGGVYTGTVVAGAVTTCTLKLTFGTAAPHGYLCSLHDQTTAVDFNNFDQVSNTTTSCTSNAATIVSGDTILYQATPF